MNDHKEQQLARKGRTAGLTIAGTMLLWLAAQWIGPQVGLPGRYAILIDLAAIAAFIWVLVVIYQIWRDRRDATTNGQG